MTSELEEHFIKCTIMSLFQHCDENVANLLRVITDTLRVNGRNDVCLEVDVHVAVLTVTQGVDRVINEHKEFNSRSKEIASKHGSPVRRGAPLREEFPIPSGNAVLNLSPRRRTTSAADLSASGAPGKNLSHERIKTYNGDYILRRYGGKTYKT